MKNKNDETPWFNYMHCMDVDDRFFLLIKQENTIGSTGAL